MPSAWASTWHEADDRITLRADGDSLVAEGEAYYPSAHPSLQDRPSGPNLGDMSAAAIPSGNHVTFAGKDAGACRVTLTLVPPFLLAADNGSCGGHNVTFTGIYQRR